jgi:hypothetical protein
MLRRPAASAARIFREAFKVCAGEIGIGGFFLKVMQATADNYEANDFFWMSFATGDRIIPLSISRRAVPVQAELPSDGVW